MPDKNPKIILASASPRRADLLRTIGVEFDVVASMIQERLHSGEAPTDYIIRIARAKVISVARQQEQGLVIGADTIVVVDGNVLGKPADEADALRMLRGLSGRWHAVMTGVALYDVATRQEVVD